MAQPWHRWPWPKVRLAVLERDGWVCQIRNPALCTKAATQVDHIVSPLDGGAWWDHGNLRASCQPCNGSRCSKDRARRNRREQPAPTTDAELVPPSRSW